MNSMRRAAPDDLRTAITLVRLTPSERAAVEQAAHERGLTLSALIREALLPATARSA